MLQLSFNLFLQFSYQKMFACRLFGRLQPWSRSLPWIACVPHSCCSRRSLLHGRLDLGRLMVHTAEYHAPTSYVYVGKYEKLSFRCFILSFASARFLVIREHIPVRDWTSQSPDKEQGQGVVYSYCQAVLHTCL